nr:tetratricopeptide repeat protein [Candidatus Sigynarchaeum springense]
MKEKVIINGRISIILEDKGEIQVYIHGKPSKFLDPRINFPEQVKILREWVKSSFRSPKVPKQVAISLLDALARDGDREAREALAREAMQLDPKVRAMLLNIVPDMLDPVLRESILATTSPKEEYTMLMNTGLWQFREKNMFQAVKTFRKVLAINPRDQKAWSYLGFALIEMHDAPGAIKAWRESLALDPGNARDWYNLGVALETQGDMIGAMDAYEQATSNDPQNYEAWVAIGKLLDQDEDFSGAINSYRKAIDIEPGYADAWNNLSCSLNKKAFLGKGMNEAQIDAIILDAIDAARNAISLSPDIAIFHTTLGEALEANKDLDGAIAAYHKALELDPNEEYAIKYLLRLGKLTRK